jgi:hypothetical protein
MSLTLASKAEEECIIVKEEGDEATQNQMPSENAAVEKAVSFLKLFDLEDEVASDALLSVFASRQEIYDGLQFDGWYLRGLCTVPISY